MHALTATMLLSLQTKPFRIVQGHITGKKSGKGYGPGGGRESIPPTIIPNQYLLLITFLLFVGAGVRSPGPPAQIRSWSCRSHLLVTLLIFYQPQFVSLDFLSSTRVRRRRFRIDFE